MSEIQVKEDSFRLWHALSRATQIGVLHVDADDTLLFSTPLARELLGCPDTAVLRSRWPNIKRRLGLSHMTHAPLPQSLTCHIPVQSSSRELRVDVHPGADGSDKLFLIRDGRETGLLETELLLASRMRTHVQLYGALAHDLRSPLNALQLTLELLTDALSNRGSGEILEQRRYCAVMTEEIARLNRILQILFDQQLSSLQAPDEEFDLRALIEEIVTTLATQAMRNRVEVSYQPLDRPVRVQTSRARLRQALMNVALNRLEALSEQGGRLHLDARADAEFITISLHAEDCGIEPELLEAMSLSGVHGFVNSSGMDLRLTRLVLESQGGAIRVDDNASSGARFDLILPRAQVPRTAFPC